MPDEQTTVEEAKTAEESTQETTQETKVEDASKTTEETVDPFEGVEKAEDGSFILRVNENTAYKGLTLKELFENAKNGIAAKDDYILKLKTESVKTPERKVETEEVLLPPNQEGVLVEVAKEFGIDPKMYNWTAEQWREYETEHGAVYATKMSNRVDSAYTAAQTKLTEQNVDFINNETLKDETSEVRELLREFGVDPQEFDYQAVLKTVYEDDNAWKKNGVRKNGTIVRAAAKAIKDVAKAKLEKQISAKKDEDLAKSRLDKSKVTSEGTTKSKVEIQKKTPLDIKDAHRLTKEELRGA